MRPDWKGRPPADNRGSGLNADSVTNSAPSVTEPTVTARYVPVSLFPPCRRRAWWAASYTCPHCQGVHLARAKAEGDLAAPRRAGCGRMVTLSAGASR